MHRGLTLYAEVSLTESAGFEPWLEKVSSFSAADWTQAVFGLPEHWRVSGFSAMRAQTLNHGAFLRDFQERVLTNL
jgi:hypothetical protein